MKLLNDNPEPVVSISSADKELPREHIPNIEIVEPLLAIDLKLKLDPALR
jgi:hypothetical protein